jgi:structural maintenance of chromosome 4
MILEDRLNAEASLEKERLERVEGSGLAIINEFRDKYREYTERLASFEEVRNELTAVKKNIDEIKEKRLTMFREGFQIISSKLKEVYQLLTRGGDA